MQRLITPILLILALVGELSSAGPREAFGQPGQFDLYVFALSWSPAFCATKPSAAQTKIDQCRLGERMVVHGLWPQAETGPNPQYCAPANEVTAEEVEPARIGKIKIPRSPSLWNHEWSKHGTCSGLTSAEYFAAIATAANQIKVPEELQQVGAPTRERLENIEKYFIIANPGLSTDQIEIRTDRQGRVSEVVICFDKDLAFTKCKNVRQASPGAGGLLLPPQGTATILDSHEIDEN